ncbi:hypothetical protein HJFPF1_03989 [Paramyrothecium foliicola]|nr:hypothetical protein HJFPF1_03989 [Paramyrothecium foliicola]
MSVSKVIAVLGATGNQGGSVVNTFLGHPGWRDAPQSLCSALEGANAIFAVSILMDLLFDPTTQSLLSPDQTIQDYSARREVEYLCNNIDVVARIPSLERFILSSLPGVSKWPGGKYCHKYSELWAKTSILEAGFFLSNYVGYPFMRPFKHGDGSVHFNSIIGADMKVPFIAPNEDTGPLVKALIDLVQKVASVTGLETKVIMVPQDKFSESVPPVLRRSLLESFAFMEEFGYTGGDPSVIHPEMLENPAHLPSVANYLAKQPWAEILGREEKLSLKTEAGLWFCKR